MKILSVVGARPNFMKIAPFVHAIERHNQKSEVGSQRPEVSSANERFKQSISSGFRSHPSSPPLIDHILVHTGQHYDERMSKSFFDDLNIPRPDIDLEIGSGSHAEQVGKTMIAFEKVLREHRPDWVVVVGDVNATCACSITAKKEHIKVAHIEAGLRSFDLDMPEEINRMVTDRLSDLLFTPDEIASDNLRKEGISEDKIKFVGNIMIDTLEAHRKTASQLDIDQIIKDNLLINKEPRTMNKERSNAYALLTLHRPSNVDKKEILEPIIDFLLNRVCSETPLIWPIHPRTRKQLETFGLWPRVTAEKNLILLHPIGYLEMLRLNMAASLMLTDSGGLQEECCVLGTPSLTLRWNTERPITLQEHGGASILVGNAVSNLEEALKQILSQNHSPQRPPLWDGHTAERIVNAICDS